MNTQNYRAGADFAQVEQAADKVRLKIGALAREFGLTLRTLRFYEDQGLLRPTRHGATRLYSERDRRRLELIIKARRLRFSLRTIVSIMPGHDETDEIVDLKLEVEQIRAQIDYLERQRADLEPALAELRRLAALPQQPVHKPPSQQHL